MAHSKLGWQHLVVGLLAIVASVTLAACGSAPTGPEAFTGAWELDKARSADIDQWRNVVLTLEASADSFAIRRDFAAGRYKRFDEVRLKADGTMQDVPAVNSSKWLDNVHLGVFHREGEKNKMSAAWSEDLTSLTWDLEFVLETSTGQAEVSTNRVLTLLDSGNALQIVETRSSRDEPLTFVFNKQSGDQ